MKLNDVVCAVVASWTGPYLPDLTVTLTPDHATFSCQDRTFIIQRSRVERDDLKPRWFASFVLDELMSGQRREREPTRQERNDSP